MIVEERDYRIRTGKLGLFVATYTEHGLPLQLEFLGGLLGYFTTEIGELNRVVSLWRYDDLADRSARRGRMLADPRWHAYLDMVTHLIETQETRILTPSSFSPIR
jgi:hypothetical protein